MRPVLTIAGFDPSSGAGVTADLLVFAAHGLFGTACITALTVQNTLGVRSTQPIGVGQISETLEFLTDDISPQGIKIGMLGEAETVRAVARFLRELPNRAAIPVVLDPVVRSSSGRSLLSQEGVIAMRDELLPLVDWVTPNLDELGALLGRSRPNEAEIEGAAEQLRRQSDGLHLVVTGGHLNAPDDLLVLPGSRPHWLRGRRVETSSTHGTGCTYSSALVSRLVLGDSAKQAALEAKAYVEEAMRSAQPLGRGHGPLNHLWPLRTSRQD